MAGGAAVLDVAAWLGAEVMSVLGKPIVVLPAIKAALAEMATDGTSQKYG